MGHLQVMVAGAAIPLPSTAQADPSYRRLSLETIARGRTDTSQLPAPATSIGSVAVTSRQQSTSARSPLSLPRTRAGAPGRVRQTGQAVRKPTPSIKTFSALSPDSGSISVIQIPQTVEPTMSASRARHLEASALLVRHSTQSQWLAKRNKAFQPAFVLQESFGRTGTAQAVVLLLSRYPRHGRGNQ